MGMINEDKDFKLEISRAVDVKAQRGNIPNRLHRYDRKIADSNKLIEEIDRYDDFAGLRISPDVYENQGGVYGIKRSTIHGGDSVILDHQQKAADRLLRELRGFGMLADVVGSGKTYEAGVVLSELAVRGKVRSLLIIAPEAIIDDWTTVMEMDFGLGKGVLLRVHEDLFTSGFETERTPDRFTLPKRPVIVSTEDFVQWDERAANVLFDVIVVDEAHRFCSEEGKYANAMRLLSLMMKVKKKAERPYCLLLSATPHSGNLEKMFRLWYFIRCRGGNPDDFAEKSDSERTREYLTEKKYYKEHVCNGASTVMEFVKRGKVSAVQMLPSCREKFATFLKENRLYEQFYGEAATYGEKHATVEMFLNALPKEEKNVIAAEVDKFVADAYHNGVLGSIMIRGGANGVSKKKNVVNLFFFPITGKAPKNGELEVAFTTARGNQVEGIFKPEALYSAGKKFRVKVDGAVYDLTLDEIAELNIVSNLLGDAKNIAVRRARSHIIVNDIFGGVSGQRDDFDPKQFAKRGSRQYYNEQLADCPAEVENRIYPVYRNPEMNSSQKEELSYQNKLNAAKRLMRQHQNERIIVFFDYSGKRGEVSNRFVEDMKKESDLASRLIVGGKDGLNRIDLKKIQEDFSDKQDAVLVVKEATLTEGVNLQKCNIIINFQVTSDPVAMDQSIGRVFRLGQENNVTIYSFADMEALEGYVLAYFSRIGLMSSNGGDATIIAGSNSESMVAVRCRACHSVALYSKEDYDRMKANDDKNLRCRNTPVCTANDPNGTYMQQITICDFKCSACEAAMIRSADGEGYGCFNDTFRGKLCVEISKDVNNQTLEGRRYYCNKICAMMHCRKFMEGGELENCPALALYREDKTASPSALVKTCKMCNKPSCPATCRYSDGPEGIRPCIGCRESQCSPGVYQFDENWQMPCPKCGSGIIHPVEASTFALYIRALWDFRYDDYTFCKELRKESAKVADVARMLAGARGRAR